MNILTFDIEEWYLERKLYGGRDFRYQMFDETFAVLLDELDKHRIKATFFCVGNLAVSFPEVVKTIAGRGHEVGCHSNEHTWLNKMTKEEVEGVCFHYLPYSEAVKRYDPSKLKAGWNTLEDGEEIYYISNPALGLWADRKKF